MDRDRSGHHGELSTEAVDNFVDEMGTAVSRGCHIGVTVRLDRIYSNLGIYTKTNTWSSILATHLQVTSYRRVTRLEPPRHVYKAPLDQAGSRLSSSTVLARLRNPASVLAENDLGETVSEGVVDLHEAGDDARGTVIGDALHARRKFQWP